MSDAAYVPYQIPDYKTHVGPGWWPILDELHEALTLRDPTYQIAQLKEKFGELRVYLYSHTTDEMHLLINFATGLSARVCEQCGAAGQLRADERRWLKTACEQHRVTTTQSPETGTEVSSTSRPQES